MGSGCQQGDEVEPNVISYNAGITACEKGGLWAEALSLLRDVEEVWGNKKDTYTAIYVQYVPGFVGGKEKNHNTVLEAIGVPLDSLLRIIITNIVCLAAPHRRLKTFCLAAASVQLD